MLQLVLNFYFIFQIVQIFRAHPRCCLSRLGGGGWCVCGGDAYTLGVSLYTLEVSLILRYVFFGVAVGMTTHGEWRVNCPRVSLSVNGNVNIALISAEFYIDVTTCAGIVNVTIVVCRGVNSDIYIRVCSSLSFHRYNTKRQSL